MTDLLEPVHICECEKERNMAWTVGHCFEADKAKFTSKDVTLHFAKGW